MPLKVKKLVSHAIIPKRTSNVSAGYDLYSTEGYVILPGHRAIVSTGISLILPEGVYGRIASRTGLSIKNGLQTGADVIDPDYTKEIKVVLFNSGTNHFHIQPGYRIAQLILERFETHDVVEETSDSNDLE